MAQLLSDARGGDATAFARPYAGHVASVRLHARRLADHEHAADDLVAQAFACTWAQLAGVHAENQPYLAVATDLGLSVEATRQLARRARDGMRRALTGLAAPDPVT